MKVNALTVVLCLGLWGSFAACSGGAKTTTPDAGSTGCQTISDCKVGQVCIQQACVNICHSNADCSGGQVCEDGTCTAPGCGSASDCQNGQICSGGSCANAPTASSVTSCDITPNPAVVKQGGTVTVSAVAKAGAAAVAYHAFTWTVTGGPGTVDQNGVVTATGSGEITVSAAAGNSTTCQGKVESYGTVASGSVRVVVVDQFTKAPVQGATVVLDLTSNKQTTAANGSVTFTSVAPGQHNVHVFSADHDYVSILNTTNTDLLVPVQPHAPAATRGSFTGTVDFTNLSVQGEAVHLAFFGSGVPGSPIDIGVQTLVGQLRPVTISLAGTTKTLSLPSGLVLGVSDNMFGTNPYKIYAEQGKRALWGLGGNLNLSAVVSALGPVLSGGTSNLDAGAILTQLLPLVGKLQAGQILDVDAGANGPNPVNQNVSIPLNTPLRLRAKLTLPKLPQQDGKYLGAAVAIGGSLAYPMGFIPLGLTAGLAAKDASNNNTAQIVDPTCDTSSGTAGCTGRISMRVAPPNNGLEGTPWGFVALAANLTGLSLGGTGSTTSAPIALSGVVKSVNEVKYIAPPADGQTVDLTGRAFMNLPPSSGTGSAKIVKSSRTVTVPADADASVKLYRIGVENHAHLNWSIWLPNSAQAQSIVLPDPNVVAGLTDPLADAKGDDGLTAASSVLLLGASLTSPNTFPGVSGFGAVTLDQLGTNVDAFTLVSVPVQ